MSRRRRRRHADPASLPRRPHPERADRDTRRAANAELTRVRESLARAIAIMLAAIVYFGAWLANLALGLFPPPEGLDLTHPQFLIGVGSLAGALALSGWLARNVATRRLATIAQLIAAALGGVLGLFVTLFVATGGPVALGAIVFGLALSWLVATVWVGVLVRRAGRLTAPSTVEAAEAPSR